jgi:putative protease
LRDRKGYRFPVRTDTSGRSHIYNSVPLDLVPALAEVVGTGVSAIRLDLQLVSEGEAAAQVRRVIQAMSAVEAGVDIPAPRTVASPSTTGHFFRGLL